MHKITPKVKITHTVKNYTRNPTVKITPAVNGNQVPWIFFLAMPLALLLLMAILGTALPPINGNPSLRPNNLLVQTHCFIIFYSALQPSYSFKQLGGLGPVTPWGVFHRCLSKWCSSRWGRLLRRNDLITKRIKSWNTSRPIPNIHHKSNNKINKITTQSVHVLYIYACMHAYMYICNIMYTYGIRIKLYRM